MGDLPCLKVADVVRRIVHELYVPDAAAMRLLKPFEFHVKKVEPLDIGNHRQLFRFVRRFEIGGAQSAAHT